MENEECAFSLIHQMCSALADWNQTHNGSLCSDAYVPPSAHASFLHIPMPVPVCTAESHEWAGFLCACTRVQLCEVPKYQVPLRGFIHCIDFFARLKCNEQNEEELQTSNTSDLSTECQYVLYGHPWENPLGDYLWLKSNMNLCYSESIPSTWQMDLQPSTKTRCQAGPLGKACAAVNSRFPAQKALLAGREKLPRETPCSLLTVRFPANMMKVKGQFLVFTSWFVFIAIPRPIQDANSIRKSAVIEFKEMGSGTQQLSRWITIILGVGMSSCSWTEGSEWGGTSLSLLLGQSLLSYLYWTQ